LLKADWGFWTNQQNRVLAKIREDEKMGHRSPKSAKK
jgi:hypothetical protein